MMGRYDAQPHGTRLTDKHRAKGTTVRDMRREKDIGIGGRTADIPQELKNEIIAFLSDGPKTPAQIRKHFGIPNKAKYDAFMYKVTVNMPEVYEDMVMSGKKPKPYIGLAK
jgi:hypothetical protein